MTTDEDTRQAADPYAYRYAVEGPVRAAAYTGPLAETEGRLYVDGTYGEIVVRIHDAGQLGNVRWEAAECLAVNYGVRGRRFEEDVWFSRQGGRFCGEERRVARHALRISGDALKVCRFAADLPRVLAAIEQAATAVTRQLGRWVRDSAHGQRWMDTYDERHRRVERRHWRRSYIRHLAGWIGPEAPTIKADMPDWSQDWLSLVSRIAQATVSAVDLTAVRDHMTEALLYAKADRAEPQPVEPARPPLTRYASVYDAIHAEPEHSDEIGDVQFCTGDLAELAQEEREATVTPPQRLAELAPLRPAGRRPAPRPLPARRRGGRAHTAVLRALRRPGRRRAPDARARPSRSGPRCSTTRPTAPARRADTAGCRPRRSSRARAPHPGRPSR